MVKSLNIPQRITRSRKSKDRQHNGQKFEDTKEDTGSRKSKDRQHNGQKFEDTKEDNQKS